MPDADITQAVTEAALKLINRSQSGEVDGEDIAREVDRSVDDMDVYYALREVVRRGELDCDAWRGGMGLPALVRLPPVT